MPRMFVKPLWLVPANGQPIPTTLQREREERRYAGGRAGLCITADTAQEARTVAWRYSVNRDQTQLDVHPATRVPVISALPRW